MADPVQRSVLMQRALQLADVDASVLSGSGTGWLIQSELEDLVTEAAARFYDLTIDILGPETMGTVFTLPIGPLDPPPVLLPGDFYQLVSLRIYDPDAPPGSQCFEDLEPVAEQSPEMTALLNCPPSNGPHFYQIRRQSLFVSSSFSSSWVQELHVWPPPLRTRALRLVHVPVFQRSAASDPVYDGIDGWARWVVLTAAIEILLKEESDTGPLERERERLEAKMRSKTGKQNHHRPKTPIDVRGAQMRSGLRWPR